MLNTTRNSETANIHLEGELSRVLFSNPENGFCIIKVDIKNEYGQVENHTIKGNSLIEKFNIGMLIECEGQWIDDPKYGHQFKSECILKHEPKTLNEIENYLKSGIIKGIGPVLAKKIVEKFGKDTIDVIDKMPEKLIHIHGISKEKIKNIIDGWEENRGNRNIMFFLQGYGLSVAMSYRVYKKYLDETIYKIKENPYNLCKDIHGIGFLTADQIALNNGVKHNEPKRICSAIEYVMQRSMDQNGHCGTDDKTLFLSLIELLGLDQDKDAALINHCIYEEIVSGTIKETEENGIHYLWLTTAYNAEKYIASNLQRILKNPLPEIYNVITKNHISLLQTVQKDLNINLSDRQKEALFYTFRNKIYIVTGGPGVGKTTLINSILTIAKIHVLTYELCAPTARAAKRMSETTGQQAQTIHRLLGSQEEKRIIDSDLLIIDEVSMVDVFLASRLLSSIGNKTNIVFLGDTDQLPSVGAGKFLLDMIYSEKIATIHLNQIFRQAATSMIVQAAHSINNGNFPHINSSKCLTESNSDLVFIEKETPLEIIEAIKKILKKDLPGMYPALNIVNDVQVLSPMHKGSIGNNELNKVIQEILNPEQANSEDCSIDRFGVRYQVGDKVIQTVNNYKKEVFNGDIGMISSVSSKNNSIVIDYNSKFIEYKKDELDEIQLSYSISIHKSQGSEFPVVIIPVSNQHYIMLKRNLLYTGITRGKKLVILIGEKKAIATCVRTNPETSRLTRLKKLLVDF